MKLGPEMEYARVGTSGLYVSKVILGAASYGTSRWQEWVLNEAEALPLLEYAFKKGINTWDTADAYSNGLSETLIGKALKKYSIPREQVVILTKIYYAIDPKTQPPIAAMMDKTAPALVNRVGLSRKHIFDAVAASVERLGTYIDVLQIHRLDRDVDPEEIMRALNDVVESGQVRYLGASSMAAWEFQKLQYIAEKHGWHKFISMQNYYNLLYREEEREMIPLCRDLGVGILPWSPLARGVLAHSWGDRSSKREETDKLLQNMVRGSRESEVDEAIVRRVEMIAEKRGVPMATVALGWCLSKGVHPITGLGSKARIDQAVEAVAFKLTQEEVSYLEELYQPKEVSY
ncbi:NADP-dependent oxidoreductase domain-containing protein [Aspergillus karnatakaensis]|uniref:aldo/keto reductase n=1 Tax=Aspergillus karnatakaensis TaxID=1810916 RepID=UPI003CCD6E64